MASGYDSDDSIIWLDDQQRAVKRNDYFEVKYSNFPEFLQKVVVLGLPPGVVPVPDTPPVTQPPIRNVTSVKTRDFSPPTVKLPAQVASILVKPTVINENVTNAQPESVSISQSASITESAAASQSASTTTSESASSSKAPTAPETPKRKCSFSSKSEPTRHSPKPEKGPYSRGHYVSDTLAFTCIEPGCNSISFDDRMKFKFHLLEAHGKKEFACIVHGCNDSFDTPQKFGIHRREAHKIWKCGRCSKEFTSYGHLKKHDYKVHTRGIFKCGTCEFTDSSKNRLYYHQVKSHAKRRVSN